MAPNTTARNLSLNRRTEVILLPSLDSLTTAALFDPPLVTFTMRIIYEGSFRPGEGSIRDFTLVDALPVGLDYLLGSTEINGRIAEDHIVTGVAVGRPQPGQFQIVGCLAERYLFQLVAEGGGELSISLVEKLHGRTHWMSIHQLFQRALKHRQLPARLPPYE